MEQVLHVSCAFELCFGDSVIVTERENQKSIPRLINSHGLISFAV